MKSHGSRENRLSSLMSTVLIIPRLITNSNCFRNCSGIAKIGHTRNRKNRRPTAYKKVRDVRGILVDQSLGNEVCADLPVTWEMIYPCFASGPSSLEKRYWGHRLFLRANPHASSKRD